MTAKLRTADRKYYVPTPVNELPPREERIAHARRVLRDADAVIIGTGSEANISVADYFSRTVAAEWMPHLSAHRSFTLDEMIDANTMIDDDNSKDYWTFWAPFMQQISRLMPPNYLRQLAKFAAGRESFIITTNSDRLEEKAGMDPGRIYRPMGDYSRLQCAMPCCDETYDAAPYITVMAELALRGEEIRPDMIPRCPVCGGYLVPAHDRTRIVSLAGGDNMGRRRYWDFYRRHRGGKVVFLELGCGLRFPAAIRAPFAQAVRGNENAFLIRCNRKAPGRVDDLQRSIIFPEDIAQILPELLEND